MNDNTRKLNIPGFIIISSVDPFYRITMSYLRNEIKTSHKFEYIFNNPLITS